MLRGPGCSWLRGALSRQLKHCSSRVWAEADSPRRLPVPSSRRVVSAATWLQACPRAQACQPISDLEKRSRGSRCAVESRRPACAQSRPRSASPLPARPSPPHPLPRLSHAARQRWAPTPAGAQPAESRGRGRARAEAGRGQGRGQDAGPGRSARQAGRGRRWAEPAGGDVVLDLRSPDLKTLPFLP